LLNEVEVEHQVQGGDGDDEQAECDSDGAGAIDGGEVDAEESEQLLRQVKDHDAASGGDDAEAKFLRYRDKT
jgi:hypothetical protein